MTDELTKRAQLAVQCIYLATEQAAADDIAAILRDLLADRERMQARIDELEAQRGELGAIRDLLLSVVSNIGETCCGISEEWCVRAINKELDRLTAAFAASPQPQQVAPSVPAGFVKPDNDRQVFFYEQDFYVLSNFSAFSVNWNGMRFDTSEALYHWLKFEFPGCTSSQSKIARQIREAASAHAAFKIAEQNKAHRRVDWDAVKAPTMAAIIRAKAAQHEYVRRKLLATGDRELIEDSWRDDFWGWGPNRDGQNVLGKLWMALRAELAAAPSPEVGK